MVTKSSRRCKTRESATEPAIPGRNSYSHTEPSPTRESNYENAQTPCKGQEQPMTKKTPPKTSGTPEKYARSTSILTSIEARDILRSNSMVHIEGLKDSPEETLAAALEDRHTKISGDPKRIGKPIKVSSDESLPVEQQNVTKSQTTATRIFLSGPLRQANKLPRGFIKDEADPMRYFFTGYYTGDGCHDAKQPGFIIRLKACEFVSLYKLLRRCGVLSPNLKFYKCNGSKSKYNAGCTGCVAWGYRSRQEDASILIDYGLPSSQKHKTDPELLEAFLPMHISKEEKKEFFLLFLLGYVMANGHIEWRYSSSDAKDKRIRYTGVALCVPDIGFQNWLGENLSSVGFDSFRMDIRDISKKSRGIAGKRHFVYIHKTEKNRTALLHGLQALEKHTIPLEGKLQILKEFLECGGHVPTTSLSAREISFHTYIEPVKNDRTACVIAQDFYDLNLFALNNILTATGFRKDMLGSIYDFKLDAFLGFIRGLDKDNCTVLQSILLAYYDSCSSRVSHEEIHDFSYKQLCKTLICSDCLKEYNSKTGLREHMLRTHNKGVPFKCTYKDCDMLFESYHERKKHLLTHRTDQSRMQKLLTCKEERCSHLQFKTKSSLDVHILVCHTASPKRESLRCEVCGLEFRTHAQLKQHQTEDHIWKTIVKRADMPSTCEYDGCERYFTYYKSYLKHVKAHYRG